VRAPHGVLIAVNARHHPNRQRFTIAHELGHLYLHQDQPGMFVDDVIVDFRVDSANPDPKELEANTFAANLLMPSDLLRADLRLQPVDPFDEESVLQMARRYGVSQQALTIRLVQSGLVRGLPQPL
jgi:Zn-dependent peptidase ImmA (M78 family)